MLKKHDYFHLVFKILSYGYNNVEYYLYNLAFF